MKAWGLESLVIATHIFFFKKALELKGGRFLLLSSVPSTHNRWLTSNSNSREFNDSGLHWILNSCHIPISPHTHNIKRLNTNKKRLEWCQIILALGSYPRSIPGARMTSGLHELTLPLPHPPNPQHCPYLQKRWEAQAQTAGGRIGVSVWGCFVVYTYRQPESTNYPLWHKGFTACFPPSCSDYSRLSLERTVKVRAVGKCLIFKIKCFMSQVTETLSERNIL